MKSFYIFLFALICSSCDSHFEKLEGIDFKVGWVNMPELTTIYYSSSINGMGEGVLPHRITDIYWNDSYILAKQCEMYSDSIIGYYIVKILPCQSTGVPYRRIGPMLENEYVHLKQKLNLDEKKIIDEINDKECLISMSRDETTSIVSYYKDISNLNEEEKQNVDEILKEIEEEFQIEFLVE